MSPKFVTFIKKFQVTWEAFIKHIQKENENIDEIDLEIKAGTNWDVKELVFRDPGMIT